jgi:hypothetical protein
MSTATVNPAARAAHPHPRHLLGNALRAARVMAGAAFEVVILGKVEERHDHDHER